MEVYLRPETEARLNDLAERTHRGTDELLEEAVRHLLAYEAWYDEKIDEAEAAIERGETFSHEQVRAWLEARRRR